MRETEKLIADRAAYASARLKSFSTRLSGHLSEAEHASAVGDHTCVYVTGSGGRLEMSEASDLDAFVLRDQRKLAASDLDTVLIQSAILRASRDSKFEDPSADGRFLRMHTLNGMIAKLGEPEDDSENTFTARMLLLLESRPLLGDDAYQAAVSSIVDEYWGRYQSEHASDYLPLVLLNDIGRYWRVLLLNHEAIVQGKSRYGAYDPVGTTSVHRDSQPGYRQRAPLHFAYA
jgi:hypothetical protein